MYFRILCLILSLGVTNADFIGYKEHGVKEKEFNKEAIKQEINKLELLNKVEEYDDIDSRIHELQKEIYFLESKIAMEKEKKTEWNINKKRSGAYIGSGNIIDIVNKDNSSIGVSYINYAYMLKAGYIKYFNNNLGAKAEAFGIFGSSKARHVGHYGIRFSFLQDINATPFQRVGLALSFGIGANNYSKHALEANAGIGISYSIGKHHRIEMERIFFLPNRDIGFNNAYVTSYSFVF